MKCLTPAGLKFLIFMRISCFSSCSCISFSMASSFFSVLLVLVEFKGALDLKQSFKGFKEKNFILLTLLFESAEAGGREDIYFL